MGKLSYEEERLHLTRICRLLFERRLVSGADGNISLRLDENTMLITPSGICKGFLEPEQLLVQKFDGTVTEGNLRSTKEAFLHIACYRARPQIGAVVHTHPPYATAFAAVGEEIPSDAIIELPVLVGNTPIVPYARPGSAELAEAVRENAVSDALLLQNHGVITMGATLTEAFIRMDALENAAQTIAVARRLGTIRRLPDGETEAIRKK